jgi:hypothetical protein
VWLVRLSRAAFGVKNAEYFVAEPAVGHQEGRQGRHIPLAPRTARVTGLAIGER